MHVEAHEPVGELRRHAKSQRDARMRIRLQAVVLAREGKTAPDIASSLGAARRPVQEWVARYNRRGVEGLRDGEHTGRPPRLAADRHDQLKARRTRARCGPTGCARSAPRTCGASWSASSAWPTPPRTCTSSCTAWATAAWRPGRVTGWRTRRRGRLLKKRHRRGRPGPRAHPDERVEVFFEDEARFGQQGTLTRTWARTGSRPTTVRQTQYDYLWVLTAACPASGQSVGLVSPSLNAGVINVFLAQMSRELPSDVHAILISEGAGFHTAGAVRVPANITLLKLPPYSPELNPVENLWHYLRSHHWSNRSYRNYDELFEAATEAWRAVCLDDDLIRTVCVAPYVRERGLRRMRIRLHPEARPVAEHGRDRAERVRA
jgi:transposase